MTSRRHCGLMLSPGCRTMVSFTLPSSEGEWTDEIPAYDAHVSGHLESADLSGARSSRQQPVLSWAAAAETQHVRPTHKERTE